MCARPGGGGGVVRAASALQSSHAREAGFVEAQVQAFLGNHDLAAASLMKMVDEMSGITKRASHTHTGRPGDMFCHADLPPAHALLGRILMTANRVEEAIGQFEAALSLDNTNADWFYELGRCCSLVQDDTVKIAIH